MFLFVMLFLVSGVLAETACTYMGEDIPCDEMPKWVWIMPVLIFGGIFIFGILFSIFWIWMLVDVVKYCDEKDKMLWVLIIVFTHWIGALIYFFVVRRKRLNGE